MVRLFLSTGPVVGNIARIITRHRVMSTLCQDKWDSVKLDLHMMARNICSICMHSAILLEVEWFPHSANQQADFISRLIDTDDRQITDAFFLFFLEDL